MVRSPVYAAQGYLEGEALLHDSWGTGGVGGMVGVDGDVGEG